MRLKHAIRAEIKSINVRSNLAHYLIWKIDSLDRLHVESKNRRNNPSFYDKKTSERIANFVKDCIDIYNETHGYNNPWTFAEMIYFLKFVWQKETRDYLDNKALMSKP